MKKWLGILWLPFLCGASFAQTATYPDRPITLIVTAAAGGVTDVAARAVGQELSKAWGQPVIVENRGGAAHILGAQSVAKADPDGYTLMVGEAGTFTINPTVYPPGKLPYDTDRDFVPISGLVRINQALIGDNNLPAANAAELIALAKQKPGQLTYGTAGIGSAPHMNMALFESMARVKLQAVHYRGAAPALNDLAGGSINLMSVSVSLALPAFRGGRVKMLGIGSDRRIAQASDIPTVAESGLPGYQAVTWFGLAGSRLGVFTGMTTTEYQQHLLRTLLPEALSPYLTTGNVMNAAPGRLAYFLGTHGPAVALDTACSSSLTAVHLACQSLRAGDCEMALAGGVNVVLAPQTSVMFSKWGMMAADGRCKTFDAAADGFVRGEGCALLVLKPLPAAIAGGDRIMAVIEGSAVNQDGRSSGLTVPNGVAQEALIRRALAQRGRLAERDRLCGSAWHRDQTRRSNRS